MRFHRASIVAALMLSGSALGGECPFEIPPDAIGEDDPLLVVTETCAQTEGALPRGPNAGCNGPAGPDGETWAGTFAELPIGVTVWGTLRADAGTQDRDWFIVRDLPEASRYLIDYTVCADGPALFFFIGSLVDARDCSPLFDGATSATRAQSCGQRIDRKSMHTRFQSVSPEGDADAPITLLRVTPLPLTLTAGYPCASPIRYWIRVNEIVPIDECDPVPDPPGVLGTDWFAENDPVHTTTFSGMPGPSGLMHEPCNVPMPGCGALTPPCDDDESAFIRLWPGKPMVGRATYLLGADFRNWDYYKFDVPARSVVSASINAGGPYAAFVYSGPTCGRDEDCTDPPGVLELTGATLGSCGSRTDTLTESRVLEPGVYTVFVTHYDFVADLPLQHDLDECAGSHDALNKYILQVDLAPAPQCEGDANADGVVGFSDITSVLSMWGASYLPMPGSGIGDANGDGAVDFGDIVATLANWLGVCP